MSRIEYYKESKQSRKDKFATAVLLVLSVAAIIFWYDKPSVVVAGIGGLLFGAYLAKYSFSSKPAVLVNEEGIRINVNGIGLVSWVDITGFERVDGPNTEFVKVLTNSDNELLSKKGGLTKMLMKSTIKRLGSPVVIPKHEFGKPLDEVIKELKEAKTTYNIRS